MRRTHAAARRLCTDLDAELGLRRSMTKRLAQQKKQSDEARIPLPAREDPRETGRVARISTAPLKPGAAEQLVAAYDSDGRTLYSSCPGFVGSLLLFDGPRRNARSITIWECKADMDAAAETNGYGATMRALAEHFVGGPEVETWRVGASLFPELKPVPGSRAAVRSSETQAEPCGRKASRVVPR